MKNIIEERKVSSRMSRELEIFLFLRCCGFYGIFYWNNSNVDRSVRKFQQILEEYHIFQVVTQ